MAVITVATGEIKPYDGSETAPLLRVFFSKPFVAANLDIIGRSTPESGDFYTEVECSVAAGVITYPSFTIPSTEDANSNENDSRMTVALFPATGGSPILILFKGLRVPATPTSTSLGAIVESNDDEDDPPAASPTAITNGGGNAKATTGTTQPVSPSVGDWWMDTSV